MYIYIFSLLPKVATAQSLLIDGRPVADLPTCQQATPKVVESTRVKK